MANNQGNTSGTNNLNHKIDTLNNSINDLVDVLEKLSAKTQSGGGGSNNPFIRPGSRRTSNQRDQDRSFYYEWSQYYKAPKRGKKWIDMSDEEKESYNKKKNNRKQKAQDYVRRSQRREDLYRDLRSNRMGSTALGRYATNLMERNQRIEDFGMMGKYMQKNAGKIGTGLFGTGKVGATATKAIGGFGKAIGGASKLLGGPWVAAVMVTIDALKMLGGAVSELLTHLANAQGLGLETSAKIQQLAFNQEKETQVANINLQTEGVKYQGDLQLKMLDMQSQIMLNALKLQTDQYVKSIGIALGPMLDGINETAYRAAESSLDFAATSQKNQNIQDTLEKQYTNYEKARGVDYKNQQDITQKNLELLSKQTEAGILESGQQIQFDLNRSKWLRQFYDDESLYNDENVKKSREKYAHSTGINAISAVKAKELYKNRFGEQIQGFDTEEDFLESLTRDWGLFRADRESQERVMKGGLQMENMSFLHPAELEAALTQTNANLKSTVASYTQQLGDKQLELEKEKKDVIIDAAVEIKKMWLQLAQKTEQFVEQFDRVTNNLGKSLGYTNRNQLNDFQKSMFTGGQVAAKFGKTYEDAAKYQQDFIESTGRNRIFDEHDYGQMFGLGEYLGDNGLASNYASQMEIFNVGVADSVDMLDNVLQDVNRIGLNGRKYTKTLVDSLKLAQKYNFKGGTENLMKMAKWAENTRFNMNSLGGMLDKISEGGLEGVITQGAQFQVLGGHAAMNADPIAMMFERYADPEAFAKRMQDMTKGYGSLDRTTGETKFSGTEQMLMEQLAKIQGRSVEDVMNEVRARNKKEVVSKQLNSNFDEDEQSFISNLATYNKKTGQFEVKVKGENGQYETKDVNQLTKEDLQSLMPEKHEERMEDYMQTIVDLLGKISGEENRENLNLTEATYDTVIQQYAERIKIAAESYAKNREKYIEEATNGMKLATQSFNDFIGIFEEGNPKVDEQVKKIEDTTNNINSALQNTALIISAANAKIASLSNISIPQSNIRTINVGNMQDGIVNNNNKPIVTQATNVTKINDGLVQSDPKDVAIFAKEGGVIGNFLDNLYNDVHSSMGGGIQLDTINVQISGSLDLSSGGQSVNIINELQNNPILLRTLSRMLSEQLSKALNGGRGSLPISIGNV